jgi:RNA polymerase sigma factor (sigma-70 family)
VRNIAVKRLPPPTTMLEDLYRAKWSSMMRLAWLMTGSREAAEDIVHDAFLRLERSLGDVREPVPYLRRIVVREVYARQRHAEVERRHRPRVLEPVFNPEVEEIWDAVRILPDRQRCALVLRFYSDHSIDEIAELLGCPSGTVKSLIHRGLARLREELEP